MRVLLDTNILIHREGAKTVRDDIGVLFHWLDKISATKCIHPGTLDEIARHANPDVVKTMQTKLQSYRVLQTKAPDTPGVTEIRATDANDNDTLDTDLLVEVAAGRVHILVTEDRRIHDKAAALGIAAAVYTIDSFLEKVTAENPELADYQVLSVKRVHFGALNLQDPFFDSFRRDYNRFDAWFNLKADEYAYACTDDAGNVVAFLYLKPEGPDENYADITPPLQPAKRLKIGTFKVTANGYKLGERFLKIIFDNALALRSEEIYVTAFRHSAEHERLIQLLEDWGFEEHGTKATPTGDEGVWVRDFKPRTNTDDPRKTYPYISGDTKQHIVSIYPDYHTDLLPDSILTTESPDDFVENKPNRNAISKVFISRSFNRDLNPGDVIVFYRTASGGPAHHTSVATTIAVVQSIQTDITDFVEFAKACRKRSIFTDPELKAHWDYRPYSRPFVVNFLYVYALPKRPNLGKLKDEDIIAEAPRGFEPLSPDAFERLLEISNANQRLVVHQT